LRSSTGRRSQLPSPPVLASKQNMQRQSTRNSNASHSSHASHAITVAQDTLALRRSKRWAEPFLLLDSHTPSPMLNQFSVCLLSCHDNPLPSFFFLGCLLPTYSSIVRWYIHSTGPLSLCSTCIDVTSASPICSSTADQSRPEKKQTSKLATHPHHTNQLGALPPVPSHQSILGLGWVGLDQPNSNVGLSSQFILLRVGPRGVSSQGCAFAPRPNLEPRFPFETRD